MAALIITICLLVLYGWWQPSFFSSLSFSNLLGGETWQETITAVGVYPRPRPSILTTEQPQITAAAVGVYDSRSRLRLWTTGDDKTQPIASITKLMTAMVLLDQAPDFEQVITVSSADYRSGGKAHFFVGDKVTMGDMFKTALIASDNTAIASLVRASGLTEEEFVQKMNEKAQRLRLKQTVFFDPTGLDSRNVSSVREVAKMAAEAFTYPLIQETVRRSTYTVTTAGGRSVAVTTTDNLLEAPVSADIHLLAGKTGYLPEAGYCFVGWFEQDGHEIITVVLGASDEDSRFTETKKLALWAYRTHTW